MVDDMQFLMLPLDLCRAVRLIGGTALSIKLLLNLEAARPPRQTDVTMPVWQLAQRMRTKPEYVRAAARKLSDVKCLIRSHDDGEWETFDVIEPDGAPVTLGRGGTVTMRTTDGWRASCDSRREVAVPVDEVGAMATRSGLLTRLRVGSLLHGREVTSDPRIRIAPQSIPDYTGYDGDLGHTAAVQQYLVPGLTDLNANSSSVRVGMETRYRDNASSHPWLVRVELRVTPLKRHARSWHVVRDAREAVR